MIISRIAIRRPVFTLMVIGAMIAFGVVALTRLGTDLFPKVDFPVVTIVTKLPGGDPETMEARVTDPIEEAVNTISGVKELRSTSAESFSQIAIEFEIEKNVDLAFQEVQARVNSVRQQLPADVDEPVVEKLDLDAAPIITVVVSADLPVRDLTRLADKTVKERLQRVRDVGSVTIVGKRDRKIWLWLDPQRLQQHAVAVQDVRNALQREHVEVPGGRVETGPLEYTTKTKAEFQSADEINSLILVQRGRETIRLQDVGFAEDGIEEERSYAQLDQTPCLALQIRRQSGTNTVAVARGVKAEVARLSRDLQPLGVRLEIAQDNSLFIEHSVHEVKRHMVLGGIVAVITVLIFLLNFRSTFVSALVLPTAIVSTFTLFMVMGFTLNMITLLALTLAIGLLIDDAIVVQESIARHVEEGKAPRLAAAFATDEIGLAVMATSLSVVAVFVPLAVTKGMIGRFFWPFGLTVAVAVLISLFVSLTLNPMMSARVLRKHGRLNPVFRVLEAAFEAVARVYEHLLAWTLRRRLLVVGLGFLSLVSVAVMARSSKLEFMPPQDRSEFNILVRGPQGASLARTRGLVEQMVQRVATMPEVKYTLYAIGADQLQKVNEASIYVKLTEKEDRRRSQLELMAAARAAITDVRDVVTSVQEVSAISGGGMKFAKLQYEIRGPELDKLVATANAILARMAKAGGFVDLQNSFETGKPEADVVIDRARAAELGVSPAQIAYTVQASIGGAIVGKFKAGSDRYDIAIRLLDDYRNRPELIGNLRVPSNRGELVELRNVASVVTAKVPVEITRFNRQRDVTVMGNLAPTKVQGPAMKEVEQYAREVGLPVGYAAGWTGESQRQQESFGYLIETMLLSVILIYMVLAAQFESFVHPLTIMVSLPLAFIGALGALLLTGQNISIFAMIAFIFLLGLVAKNAILLIDYANTLRSRDGMARDAALRRAGRVRLRPILMTTCSIVAGMMPTAVGMGAGSETRRPMAIAIIGGLITSMLLTLLVVPAVYSLLDPISEYLKHHFLDRQDPAPPAPPAPPAAAP